MSPILRFTSLSSLVLSSCITMVQSDGGGGGGGGGAGGGGGGGGGAAGGGDGVVTEKPSGNSSKIDVNGYAAHGSLGASGGSVTMPNGPTLDAPSGALPGATGFGLGAAKQGPTLPAGTTAVSPWYELVSDKNDLRQLSKPLTLSVPIQLPGGASAAHPGLRVLVNAGSTALLPIEGKFDAASGRFKIELPGTPPKLTFAVTFNPSVTRLTSDEVSEAAPSPPAPPPSGWSTVSWTLAYDAQVVTKLQATKVLFYARRAAREYSNAGLREPSLVQEVDGASKRWVVHLTAGGSYFQSGVRNGVGEDALGRLYVDTGRIDDPKTDRLGSVYASIAHEMYHSIFSAHRIPHSCFDYEEGGVRYCYPSDSGLDEGMATAVGYFLDQGAAKPRPSVPFQAVGFPLGYFSSSAQSEAYRNQDFFVYQLRSLGLAAFGKQMEGLRAASLAAGAGSVDILSGYHVALESTADGWPDGLRAGHLQYVYQRVYSREKGPLWSAEPRDAKAAKYSLDKALFVASTTAKVAQQHCKMLVDGVTCEIDVNGHTMGASRIDIDMKTDGSSLPPGYKPNEVQGTFKVTAEGGSVGFFVVAQKAGIGSADSVALSPTGADVTLGGLNSKYDEVYVVAVPFGKGTAKVHLKLDVKPQTLSSACAAASKWMCTCQPGGAQPCWVWDMAVQQGCQSGPSCDEWCSETAASYASASKDAELWAAMGCTAGP